MLIEYGTSAENSKMDSITFKKRRQRVQSVSYDDRRRGKRVKM